MNLFPQNSDTELYTTAQIQRTSPHCELTNTLPCPSRPPPPNHTHTFTQSQHWSWRHRFCSSLHLTRQPTTLKAVRLTAKVPRSVVDKRTICTAPSVSSFAKRRFSSVVHRVFVRMKHTSDICSSGILSGLDWYLFADVSGLNVGSVFKGPAATENPRIPKNSTPRRNLKSRTT